MRAVCAEPCAIGIVIQHTNYYHGHYSSAVTVSAALLNNALGHYYSSSLCILISFASSDIKTSTPAYMHSKIKNVKSLFCYFGFNKGI